MIKNKKEIINLGFHPYADTFISKKLLFKSEPVVELACVLNKKNFLIQNKNLTSEIERYNLYDYSYTSSNSSFSREYWKKYFFDICGFCKKEKIFLKNSNILEIGSNDGFLLKFFKNFGCKVLGIDASSAIAKIANKKKIKTLNMIFDYKSSKKIKTKFDIILANNVMNHANNPTSFLKGVKFLMKKKTIFIVEFPYWYNLIKDKKFDQIYHEHISYFTVHYFKSILKKIGLKMLNVENSYYHGGSLRIFIIKKNSNYKEQKKNINKFLNKEKKANLFKDKTYQKFMEEITIRKINFLKKLFLYKKKNYKIVGIGAAAKGNTMINFLGLDYNLVDFVTDTSKHKIGKYLPKSRIPILTDKKLKKLKKVCVFILSWNLEKLLKKKIIKINKNAKFITY